MKINKKNLEQEAETVLNYYKAGEYSTVETKAKEVLKKHSGYLFIYNIYGLALYKQKKYEEAIKIYKYGLEINPNTAIIHNNLGNALNAIGETDEALVSYSKSIKINPKFSLAYNNLGNLLKDLNKFEEAEKNYKKSIENQPDFFLAYHNLATIYQYLGRFSEAKDFYKKSLKINPGFHLSDRQLSSSIKYSESNEHFKYMKSAITKDRLTDDQKMNLSFGLGKAYDDIKNYDLAFKNYLIGNKIKRKKLNYSIEEDVKFFNNLKEIFKKSIFEKFEKHKNTNNKIIFILGMPRSGTSLIEQILSSHRKVYGAGELRDLDIIVKRNLFYENKFALPKNTNVLNDSTFKKIGDEYINILKKFSIDKQFITDKAPSNFLWLGIIKIALPNAKIIHCKRNPKDTCFSIFKNFFAGNLDYAYNLNELVSYYNLYYDLMKYWHTVMPDFIHEINYEDMISDQENETKKLLNICELNWDVNCLSYHKNKRPIKTASAVQARKPIYKTSLNSWKNYEKHLKEYFEKLNFI